jgi:colicin import membrane protein
MVVGVGFHSAVADDGGDALGGVQIGGVMSVIELDRTKIAIISQTETAIAELREQYMSLSIAGPEDRKGFLAVSEARKDVKARRVKVEHARKALKEDALAYGRLVDGEAKRITAMLEPIEDHLQKQEDGYEAARDAIKRQAEESRKAKLQSRVDALQAVRGAVPLAVLEALTDEQFAAELAKATEADNARKAQEEAAAKAEAERKAEADRLRKEEEARIAAERAKLEAERKAQEEAQRIEREKIKAERRKADEAAAAERAKQAEAQRLIEEERRKLEAEKARLEREEFERQAKVKAEHEAREKVAREQAEQARLEAERKEREVAEAARREAMKPDLQRLREYIEALESVPIPSVSDPNVYQIVLNAHGEVERMCERVEKWCDEQEAVA